jgi:hypothetical protein
MRDEPFGELKLPLIARLERRELSILSTGRHLVVKVVLFELGKNGEVHPNRVMNKRRSCQAHRNERAYIPSSESGYH